MRPNRLVSALLALVLAAVGACRGSTDPHPLTGTWLATTFQVTPAGQGQKNVLAAGGTLGVNIVPIDSTFLTTGTVILPASVTGAAPFTASLAGTAVEFGNTVRFATAADSFMKDLAFTLVENRLEAVNQVVAGTNYNIVLTRQ
jgi:hypothetical protein